jgi:serpin B
MIIVLPDEETDLDEVLKRFDLAELVQLRAELRDTAAAEVSLRLPRFRARSELSLKQALQEIGLVKTFDWTQADFSAMSGQPAAEVPLAISDVRHCALVEVTEKGTEAAAATMVTFHIGGAPISPEFHVDRPFLFFIVNETTEAILFQGKVVDPS